MLGYVQPRPRFVHEGKPRINLGFCTQWPYLVDYHEFNADCPATMRFLGLRKTKKSEEQSPKPGKEVAKKGENERKEEKERPEKHGLFSLNEPEGLSA